MIGSCDYLFEGALGAIRLHDAPYKLGSTICDKTFGPSKAGHNFLANEAGNGSGSMVGGCSRHWPISEVIDGSNDVFLFIVLYLHGSHNV